MNRTGCMCRQHKQREHRSEYGSWQALTHAAAAAETHRAASAQRCAGAQHTAAPPGRQHRRTRPPGDGLSDAHGPLGMADFHADRSEKARARAGLCRTLVSSHGRNGRRANPLCFEAIRAMRCPAGELHEAGRSATESRTKRRVHGAGRQP